MIKKAKPVKGMSKVTFVLSKEIVGAAKKANLVGEFNNWSLVADAMTKQKDGSFSVTKSLATGKDYQFRYIIDGERWENDCCADKYEKNEFGSENSVVAL